MISGFRRHCAAPRCAVPLTISGVKKEDRAQFRNVFFGPENRNGVRAGRYINDIGAPLFGRFVKLFFDVAKDEGLPNRDDLVVAHTWWFTIFGLHAHGHPGGCARLA